MVSQCWFHWVIPVYFSYICCPLLAITRPPRDEHEQRANEINIIRTLVYLMSNRARVDESNHHRFLNKRLASSLIPLNVGKNSRAQRTNKAALEL